MSNVTKVRYQIAAVTDNVDIANVLAKQASPHWDKPGVDEELFSGAIELTNGKVLLEWWASKTFTRVIDAMNDDAPITDPRLAYLVDAGRLDATGWQLAKDHLHITYLNRAPGGLRMNFDDPFPGPWLAENGYEIA